MSLASTCPGLFPPILSFKLETDFRDDHSGLHNTFRHSMNPLGICNQQGTCDTRIAMSPEAETTRRPTELRKSVSAPPILSISPRMSKPSAPTTILKSQPRIPLELQAIFLESSRNGTAHIPPPSKVASKVFFFRRWFSKSTRETHTAEDGTERENEHPQGEALRVRRHLSFGCNETATFKTSDPSDELYYKRSRWSAKKAGRTPEMPPRLPCRSC